MVIIIPAYEPDEKLVKLVEELNEKCGCRILIVDDGSGEKYKEVFKKSADLGATVVSYEKNKGKGGALKTAFNIVKTWDDVEGIVTADCDGQHLPEDILKIMNTVKNNRSKVILGTRHFTGKVPLRSIIGNRLTSAIFFLTNGKKLTDTQTGLRGFSTNMLDWLCEVSGEAYEYEMNVLLECEENGYEMKEVPIDTVYLKGNESSHFNPIKDSIKIYLPILKFSMSSIISALVDFILLMVIQTATSSLFAGVVGSRLCSAALNYTINKSYVFSKGGNKSDPIYLPRYALLALSLMLINYIVLNYFYTVGINLVVAKLMTEMILFIFSFCVQKRYVFKYN